MRRGLVPVHSPVVENPCCKVLVGEWTPELADLHSDVSSDGTNGPPCLVSEVVDSFTLLTTFNSFFLLRPRISSQP